MIMTVGYIYAVVLHYIYICPLKTVSPLQISWEGQWRGCFTLALVWAKYLLNTFSVSGMYMVRGRGRESVCTVQGEGCRV